MRHETKLRAIGWAVTAVTVLALNFVWLLAGAKTSIIIAITVLVLAIIVLVIERLK